MYAHSLIKWISKLDRIYNWLHIGILLHTDFYGFWWRNSLLKKIIQNLKIIKQRYNGKNKYYYLLYTQKHSIKIALTTVPIFSLNRIAVATI